MYNKELQTFHDSTFATYKRRGIYTNYEKVCSQSENTEMTIGELFGNLGARNFFFGADVMFTVLALILMQAYAFCADWSGGDRF
jgi:hypothetical protein